MIKSLLSAVAVAALLASPAGAETIDSYADGTGELVPSVSSPGTSFTLDFTPILSDQAPPHQAVGVLLGFDCHTPYSQLNIQLSSGPDVHTFAPTAPSEDQTAALLYDPAYLSGEGDVPSSFLPEAWKTELADGLLQGTLWVDGTPFAPEYASLNAQGSYLVPEPATLALVGLGALAALGRRRDSSGISAGR